jgi:hypothetical protein
MTRLLEVAVSAGLAAGAVFAIGGDRGAYADAFTTGGVRGVVKDKSSGEASVGATVVATSPALQGEQVVIADETGGYYITSLPPGVYTLTVYYNDAKFSRQDVLVQVGKEVVVNIQIDTAVSKGETIAIQGNAPIVDQGSTKVGTTITSEFTNNVPSQRTFGEVAGGVAGAQSDRHGVSFAGATSAENTYVVEGLNTTDTGFGILSSNLPNEFIQETEVITGGYNAEFGRAIGAIVNVVTKSGSNEFHGSVFGHWQPKGLTADAELIRRQGTAIDAAFNQDGRYDYGAELGGPILKDKLWFHVGFTPTVVNRTTTRIINREVDKNQDGVSDVDPNTGFTVSEQVASRDIPGDEKTYYFTAKLTGAISQNHQWQVTLFGNPETDTKLLDVTDPTVRDPGAILEKNDKGAYDVSAKWTSKLNEGKTQIDVVVGFHNAHDDESPLSSASDVPAIRYDYTRSLYDFADLENRGLTGGQNINGCRDSLDSSVDDYPRIRNCPVLNYTEQGLGFLESRTNNRTSAVIAVTQRVKLLGQHVFKAGFDLELSTYDSRRRYTGGSRLDRQEDDFTSAMPLYGPFTSQQYIKYDTNGTIPCGIDAAGDGTPDARCSVIQRLDANTSDRSIAAYIQDQWQVLPNLTINAGLRWEWQTGYVAEFLQNTIAPDTGEVIPSKGFDLNNLIAPRLGFIYDPTQEGKSKLFGHWGRFYENVPMDMNIRSFGGETTLSAVNGVNGAGKADNSCLYDHGAADLANQVLTKCMAGTSTTLGGGISYVAPGMNGQYTEELIVGAEYELLPDFTVGANYIHRTLPVVIEDMSTDGGNTYFIGNPSQNYDAEAAKLDQQAMRETDPRLKALMQSRAEQLRAVKNFDPPSRNYDALQLIARKRPTGRSLIQATYTYSRAKGNYPGLYSTENNQLDPNITSQYDLPDLMPNRYGPSSLDRPHSLKVDGFYQWSFGAPGLVVLGASFRALSGVPANTLAAHPVYEQNESYLLPRGALYRSPMTSQLDAHISYGQQISKTRRIEVFFDFFNLLNSQDEVSVDPTYTTDVSLPIVGGDANDLLHAKRTVQNRQTGNIITPNKNYGKLNARQTPFVGQVGARFTF